MYAYAAFAALILAFPSSASCAEPALIGFLNGQSPQDRPYLLDAFRRGLKESGFEEGRNLRIEYRWAENKNDRLPDLAKELVQKNVAVIVATGGNAPSLVAKGVTSTIPIVFTNGGDPVKTGVVPRLNRPGGNITGISWFTNDTIAKRMELLRDLVPQAKTYGLLRNPKNPEDEQQAAEAVKATNALGVRLVTAHATAKNEIEGAFASFAQQKVDAVVIAADPFFTGQRQTIVELARRNAVPAIYGNREFVYAGGLMSYGSDVADIYRRAGGYTARILKGEKPGDMPVDQAMRFELIVNAEAIRALGLKPPPHFLAIADVISP